MTAKLTTGVLGATGYSGMELSRILAHHPKIEAPRLFRRQVGVEALIRYGRCLKIATPEAEFKPDQLRPIFDLLEQKLDPKQDRSRMKSLSSGGGSEARNFPASGRSTKRCEFSNYPDHLTPISQ